MDAPPAEPPAPEQTLVDSAPSAVEEAPRPMEPPLQEEAVALEPLPPEEEEEVALEPVSGVLTDDYGDAPSTFGEAEPTFTLEEEAFGLGAPPVGVAGEEPAGEFVAGLGAESPPALEAPPAVSPEEPSVAEATPWEPAPAEPLPAPAEPLPPPEAHVPLPTPSFGKRDPKEKAQRLARVLVSDIILYNPERHQKALAAGRLREDLDDEIQRSWSEYVEQVGEETATSTPFFQDALNEILAKGEQIF